MRLSPAERFEGAWRFARGLTLDLLDCLDQSELLFTPGKGLGPLWKQFRHVGRIQECYMRAVQTGIISFASPIGRYAGGVCPQTLAAYLRELDMELHALLNAADWDRAVAWGDERIDLYEHLSRLAHHETLHHGQWIVYMRLMGKPMPPSWRAWGV